MSKLIQRERGQALVIVAFGMAALIGMAALAIDGGNVYSDRRHAQNAADTSALAAGLGFVRQPSDWSAASAAGFQKASENGYDNNGTSNTVHVYQCTDVDATCNLPPAETYTDSNGNGIYDASEPFVDTNGNGVRDTFDPVQFIQATIESIVPTYLARVVGIPQLTNNVEALVQAVPPSPTTWYSGKALVAVMPGCKSGGWPNDPFVMGGNSVSLVNGSGVFVNSNCDPAFEQSGTSSTMTVPTGGICVVGGADATTGVNPPPDEFCGTQTDEQLYQLPAVDSSTCTVAGSVIDEGGGNYLATPGYYNSVFPSMTPANILRFVSGVYCFRDGFKLSSNWVDITTDLDGNGTFDGSDGGNEGVMFFVENGEVTFNGGSLVHLGAMNNPSTHPAVKGYLIYLPPENNSTVKLTGGNGSSFVGTILAPSSLITIEGNQSTDSLDFDCQIIGYSLSIGGSGNLNIVYHQNKNGTAWSNPVLQLYR